MRIFRSEEDCRMLLDLTTPKTFYRKNKFIVEELLSKDNLSDIDKDYLKNMLTYFENEEDFEICQKIFSKIGTFNEPI